MLQGITSGIGAYSEALTLVRKLRLWKYFLLPGLVSLLIALGILSLAWFTSDDIGGLISRLYPWDWGRSVVDKIADVFGGLLVLALGVILYKNIVIALVGPLLSPISERIEAHLAGSIPVRSGSMALVRSTGRGIRLASRNIARELFFTVILLLLGLFPLFSPFTAVLIFVVQSYYAGFGNTDYLLERHFQARDSIRWVRQNRGLAIGNGLIFMLLLLTGVGFLIAPPLGAAAATVAGVKRLQNLQVKS